MTLRAALLALFFASASTLLLAQAPAKPAAAKAKSLITVTVPTEDAELTIEKQAMKTPGEKREFDTPELEAGQTYEYEFSAKWMPNNYTTITRKRTVKFKAGEPLTVDLTKEEASDKYFIRYVPTPDDIVKKMLELAKVTKEDTVFDLGCGDGRLVIAAAKFGAKKGVGIDLDKDRVKESKENVAKEKVGDKVEIREGDLLEVKDLDTANVVLMYLSDELGKFIQPKLMKDLKPGTRVVSHRFTIGDWKPDQTITVKGEDGDEYTLHIWTVKAK
ncbi:hypothetical protein BH11PLA2_BH11PLA2_42910 [soil metagenome]